MRVSSVAFVILWLALAARAEAYVYWPNWSQGTGTTIGRAELDGSNPDFGFIKGASGPCGVTVDRDHVYWDNFNQNAIARASLDGTHREQTFVPGAASGPCGVAVDDRHIYWMNFFKPGGGGGESIGRADLDGGSPDETFITGTDGPCGAAVDATYLYWANFNTSSIGRARLDGTVPPDPEWIKGASFPCGVAIDDDHIYWGNCGG